MTSGAEGRLYATICRGGPRGAILSMDATGDAREFHAFENGACPSEGVIEDDDGALYGIATSAGTSSTAFVYKLKLTGRLTTIASFDNYEAGGRPLASLSIRNDGALYGAAGGSGTAGSIFRIDKACQPAVLYAFPGNGTMGADPTGPLVEAADGNFDGTTTAGGAHLAGTVFRVTPEGEERVIHSFDAKNDGGRPAGGLVIGADGPSTARRLVHRPQGPAAPFSEYP